MVETRKLEVERLAKQAYGPDVHVFKFGTMQDRVRQEWFGVSVGGRIIGCRRELNQLQSLIQRGPLMDCIGKI